MNNVTIMNPNRKSVKLVSKTNAGSDVNFILSYVYYFPSVTPNKVPTLMTNPEDGGPGELATVMQCYRLYVNLFKPLYTYISLFSHY